MPRRRLTPQEKKALSYERDHYNRGGQHLKSWRRLKPRKKRKSVHAYRRQLRLQLGAEEEGSSLAARRRYGNPRQKHVHDWGATDLATFVRTRQARSQKKASPQ